MDENEPLLKSTSTYNDKICYVDGYETISPQIGDIYKTSVSSGVLPDERADGGVVHCGCGVNSNQYIVALLTLLAACNTGQVYGFSSPTIGALKQQGLLISNQQVSLFTSIIFIGVLLGCFLSIATIETVGRKPILTFSVLPSLLGWILIIAGPSFPWLLAGRALGGLGVGGFACGAAVYTSEAASKEKRGLLMLSPYMGLATGNVLVLSLGLVLSPQWLAVVCLLPIASFVLGVLFLPESPRFLLKKGRESEAREALVWLRNSEGDAIDAELAGIRHILQQSNEQKVSLAEFFRERRFVLPMLLSQCVVTVSEFCGITAIVSYAEPIFVKSGYQSYSGLAALLIVVDRFIAYLLMAVLIQTFRRRILFIVSCSILTVSAACMGLYFYLTEAVVVGTDLRVVPLVCLLVFVAGNTVGIGPLTGIISAEIFPLRARGFANVTLVFSDGVLAFITTYAFLPMTESLYYYGTFWFYSVVSLAGVVLGLFFLPETKDKSLEEIEEIMSGAQADES